MAGRRRGLRKGMVVDEDEGSAMVVASATAMASQVVETIISSPYGVPRVEVGSEQKCAAYEERERKPDQTFVYGIMFLKQQVVLQDLTVEVRTTAQPIRSDGGQYSSSVPAPLLANGNVAMVTMHKIAHAVHKTANEDVVAPGSGVEDGEEGGPEDGHFLPPSELMSGRFIRPVHLGVNEGIQNVVNQTIPNNQRALCFDCPLAPFHPPMLAPTDGVYSPGIKGGTNGMARIPNPCAVWVRPGVSRVGLRTRSPAILSSNVSGGVYVAKKKVVVLASPKYAGGDKRK
ncbi:hypothetical protein JOM56_015470 [Amanita muscaria]